MAELGSEDVDCAVVWRDIILRGIVCIVYVAKRKVVRSACPQLFHMHARPSITHMPGRKWKLSHSAHVVARVTVCMRVCISALMGRAMYDYSKHATMLRRCVRVCVHACMHV